MLKDARPRSEGDYEQLRELPYCANSPSSYGCAGAKPLAMELQEQFEKVALVLRLLKHVAQSKNLSLAHK